MNFQSLPNGWFTSDVQDQNSIYGKPPESTKPDMILFYGMSETDKFHKLYMVPKNTPTLEIIQYFKVGEHGEQSFGFLGQSIKKIVTDNIQAIEQIVPVRVYFADSAGLKLKFKRQITESELEKIEALFPDDKAIFAGLDGYISEWDGASRLLEPVLKKNEIEFWWD